MPTSVRHSSIEQSSATGAHGSAVARHTVLAPWQVRRVAVYVESNLNASIRNIDLAACARLSECHFNHAFRNSVGNTPHEYVIRRRVQRAQGLMLATEAPLSQVAAECGFADQAHFSRLFRKVVGDSPGAWRKARVDLHL